MEVSSVGAYIDHVEKLCNSVEVKNWTGCAQFKGSVADRFRHLKESKSLVTDITGDDSVSSRWKRGLLNFVGEISKILFGTLDENDADYYEEQIRHFERNSEDTTELLKQQIYVVRSTLGALNDTLADMQINGKLVKQGLADIQTYLDSLSSETARKFSIFEAKLVVENHISRVSSALTLLQRNMDLVIDSVLHAQAGNVHPQIVPPQLLLTSLKESQSFFPQNTILPFPLSKNITSLLYQVSDVQVYVRNGRLSYVVSVPLVNKGEFKVYYLVPIPVPVNTDKLVYVKIEKSIVCVDQTRHYYYFSTERELDKCKKLLKQKYVCKQSKPFLSSLVQEECAVLLLQVRRSIPNSCEVSVVKLTNTVWTQVSDNEWVYYVPGKESITVLCADRDPVDVPLRGAGKLVIRPTCKGYSKAALLQPLHSVTVKNSQYKESKLVQVKLQNECCEELGTRVNLSKLHLNLHFRETISHADDLRYAGVKITELEKHILEHEWQEKHTAIHHGYSVVFYIVVCLISLYIVVKVVLCMKGKGLCQWIAGVLGKNPDRAMTPALTGSGNIVNINIKTSNESLAAGPEDTPLRALKPTYSKEAEREERTTRRSRSAKSCF